ncbi:MAG: hypothetical protein QM657_09400 [Lacrimispora sp.]|uniref:hypothetical protein n=1 Tax=Lacrimispora sp. TaxID=2719234 RepID=UPI0039E66D4B
MSTKKEKKAFPDLYRYFCGMLTKGKMDDLYGQMMGAIPDLSAAKRTINLPEK